MNWENLIHQFVYDKKSPIIFNSGIFIWLFTGFIVGYYYITKIQKQTVNFRLKTVYCILFSLYFYYKSSGIYFLLLVASTVVDFWLGQLIYSTKNKQHKILIIVISLIINLGMLCYFKYTNFFGEIFGAISGNGWSKVEIFLPVGVSFFTFQSLSYIIDIYRGEIKPLNNIIDYAFFITFFPQLVAGPIVRAKDFIPQMYKPAFLSKADLNRALQLIAIGLFNKAVISDYIAANFVDRVFENPNLYTGLENLFGVYGYALQIYCDFSGYSNMAIGVALLLGFHFPRNFDLPYRSINITEFWRRWHISLSSWLRDYLYISMGGNRYGEIRTYLHLFVTMLLGGLWHGAGIQFIIWGALHGLALAVHKLYVKYVGEINFRGSKFISSVITFHFVCFCWIFFRASNLSIVGDMLTRIFAHFNSQILFEFIRGYKWIMVLMITGYIMHWLPQKYLDLSEFKIARTSLLGKVGVLLVVIVVVMQVKSSEIAPFIYFNF